MDTQAPRPISDVERMLGDDGAKGATSWKRWVRWAALALIVMAAGYFFFGRGGGQTTYVTREVTRGEMTVTVTATGNLEPRNQVDIGSELSGTVRSVNVEVNAAVKAGQVLAILDQTRLNAQVLQAESSLTSAQARVIQSEASVKEARANHARLERVHELSGGKLPSQQDMDVAEAALARAQGDAAAAKAAVAQSRANLEAVRTDLSKARIRSPINGVVLVRAVEPGQTVAASLQVATLFTLAEDLKKMELHVSVDEADVGAVQIGQKATFTVDAWPSRSFSAHITQMHLASNNTQKTTTAAAGASATSTGVVTYETVLEVDNSGLLLRPGMTATAEIVTTRIDDAVLVPNAALRFTPEGAQLPGAPAANPRRGPLSALMPQVGRRGGGFGGQQSGARAMSRAWILEDGKPALVMFRPGASDGQRTQVLESGTLPNLPEAMAKDAQVRQALERRLEAGMQVIVDAEVAKP